MEAIRLGSKSEKDPCGQKLGTDFRCQAFLPGFFTLWLARMAKSKAGSASHKPRATDSEVTFTDDQQASVDFLGRKLSPDEYSESCRNLQAFFDLLRAWHRKGRDE